MVEKRRVYSRDEYNGVAKKSLEKEGATGQRNGLKKSLKVSVRVAEFVDAGTLEKTKWLRKERLKKKRN